MEKVIIHIENGEVRAVHSTIDFEYIVVQQEQGFSKIDTQVGAGINRPDSVQSLDLTNPLQYCDLL